MPADYDGDGRTDLAVFRPSDGTWWVYCIGTGVIASYQWGMTGDIPVPRDYDGDGLTDIAIWRESTLSWAIYYLGTNTQKLVPQGAAGDVPIR